MQLGWDRQGMHTHARFDVFTAVKTALGPTLPPIQWVLGLKRPGREAGHSSLSSDEVKNASSYTSTSSFVFTS
jgi:hypothetical protein